MSDYRSRQERRQSQAKNKSKGKGKGNGKGLFKKIVLAFSVFVLLCIIGGGIFVFAAIKGAPKLKGSLLDSPMSSVIYDKNGKKVTDVFDKHNRLKVNIKNVPPLMKKAVVSIEDRRFYQHHGIDPRRIVGAAVADVTSGHLVQGASTIDQQVVKRVFLSPRKTFTRKIQGAWLAIQLDRHYTKDQILQMYLNQIYYGHGAYGIKEASEVYFGTTDLSKLNLSQMALLAGLPNLPSADDPINHPSNAKSRRNTVLKSMVTNGVISNSQAQKAEAKSIKSILDPHQLSSNKKNPPYYGAFDEVVYNELVKQEKVIGKDQFYSGGLKIYTTYDPSAQKKVYNLQHSNELNYPDKYFNSGIALIDTQSGAIRAIGGGRKYSAQSSGINFATAKTDIGSTAKPIADYGPAIEYLKWSTYHPLKDTPYKWPGTNKSLHDWDSKYRGKMTARDALAYSRNIPAARTMFAVGKDKAAQFASSLGINVKKPVPGTFSIGSFQPGASPLQMAGAYAAFGDQGVYHKPYAVKKIVFPDGRTIVLHHKPKVVMHDYTSYMITDMLKSVINYGTASGLGQSLPSGLPVAGKTGSVGLNQKKYPVSFSRPLSDEWFVGYTPQYTMAVWTGYSSIMHHGKAYYVKGGQHSEHIAMDTFQKVISSISSSHVSDWKKPDSVVKVKLEKGTGLLASNNTPSSDVLNELFVKGTQPSKVSTKYNKPDKPANLQASYDDKSQSINLKWDYPKTSKGVKYTISYSVDGGNMKKLTTTDKTNITLNNASPGSTYTFQVVATIGSKNSDPAQTTLSVKASKPQPPNGLSANYDANNNMIVINWSGAQSGQNGNPSYEVTYSIDGGQPQKLGTTNQNQGVINNPKPDSTYTISVVTIEGNQKSDPATTSVQVPSQSSTGGSGGSGSSGGGGSNGDGKNNGSPTKQPPTNGPPSKNNGSPTKQPPTNSPPSNNGG